MYKINMLPLELQRNTGSGKQKLLKSFVFSTIAVVILAAYGSFLVSGYRLKIEIADAEKELAECQDQLAGVAESNRQLYDEQLSRQSFQNLINHRKTWSPLLEELDTSLPVDVWLERISLSYVDADAPAASSGQAQGPGVPVRPPPVQTGRMPGVEIKSSPGAALSVWPSANLIVVNGYSRTVPSIGILVYRLGQMPGLEQVTLNEIKEDQTHAAYRFTITAALGGKGE